MMAERAPRNDYAEVNGLRLYYEIHGDGAPLVLLHGGVVGILMFGPTLPALAESRQVIAVELQGHGRTADSDRPLSFEAMADDIAGLLAHLDISEADILGYSLGGGVALQLAIRHPEVVRRLVIVAAPAKHAGWFPEVREDFARMDAASAAPMKHSPLAEIYPDLDWEALFTKLGALLSQDYDWSQQVAAFSMPVLLVYADADAVTPSHIIEFYRLLGGGQRDAGLDGSGRSRNQLAILPGRTHYDVITAPLLPTVVTAFLDAPLP
ncbi:MAG TPA: alpha/beta fold hydrolase [Nitrolancea sp.]|nr:alpha/beta fold hydrolase [Nitrolancea sp.]